jgi:hypothetical protein
MTRFSREKIGKISYNKRALLITSPPLIQTQNNTLLQATIYPWSFEPDIQSAIDKLPSTRQSQSQEITSNKCISTLSHWNFPPHTTGRVHSQREASVQDKPSQASRQPQAPLQLQSAIQVGAPSFSFYPRNSRNSSISIAISDCDKCKRSKLAFRIPTKDGRSNKACKNCAR